MTRTALACNLNRDLIVIPTRRTRRDPVNLDAIRAFTDAANDRARRALVARDA